MEKNILYFSEPVIKRKKQKWIVFSKCHPFEKGWWVGTLIEKNNCYIFLPVEVSVSDIVSDTDIIFCKNCRKETINEYIDNYLIDNLVKRITQEIKKNIEGDVKKELEEKRQQILSLFVFENKEVTKEEYDFIPNNLNELKAYEYSIYLNGELVYKEVYYSGYQVGFKGMDCYVFRVDGSKKLVEKPEKKWTEPINYDNCYIKEYIELEIEKRLKNINPMFIELSILFVLDKIEHIIKKFEKIGISKSEIIAKVKQKFNL